MDCPRCNLRYNAVTRKPMVHQCGHSLCDNCCKISEVCLTCQKVFDKSKSFLNHSLMEILTEHKQTSDIDKYVKVCFVG
jgi:hypothetical protein